MNITNAHGVEIDHGDKDISAALRNNKLEIGIGKEYGGGGYTQYLDIILTLEEAHYFKDWLVSVLDT